MLNVSERFRNDHRIVFLVIGGGHQIDGLAREVKSRGLEQTYWFVPYQDAGASEIFLRCSRCALDLAAPEIRGAYRSQQILWHRCRRAANDLDRRKKENLAGWSRSTNVALRWKKEMSTHSRAQSLFYPATPISAQGWVNVPD